MLSMINFFVIFILIVKMIKFDSESLIQISFICMLSKCYRSRILGI